MKFGQIIEYNKKMRALHWQIYYIFSLTRILLTYEM